MKIIDFEKCGNVVRFYLGSDDVKEYHGDDWDDIPYECNAGLVYDEYVTGRCDIAFPFDFAVLEPCDTYDTNCRFCKDDFKDRKAPCIIAVPQKVYDRENNGYFKPDNYDEWASGCEVIKFYFGDHMEPTEKMVVYEESNSN